MPNEDSLALSPETLIHEIEMRTGYTAPAYYRMPKGALGLYPGEQPSQKDLILFGKFWR
jgi:hypothetical protein